MENAIVAVTNGKPSLVATKFWVELSINFGNASSALVDSVFFKDGLVLMEGVIGIATAKSSVKVTKELYYSRDHVRAGNKRCTMKLWVEINNIEGNVVGAKYGKQYASLVVKRDVVGRVEGLQTTSDLKFPWFKTVEEARQEADEEQIKVNKETRKRNAEVIGEIAECRRQIRAYAAWKAMPWAVRTLFGLKRVMKRTLAIPEDKVWAVAEADKLGAEYDV